MGILFLLNFLPFYSELTISGDSKISAKQAHFTIGKGAILQFWFLYFQSIVSMFIYFYFKLSSVLSVVHSTYIWHVSLRKQMSYSFSSVNAILLHYI